MAVWLLPLIDKMAEFPKFESNQPSSERIWDTLQLHSNLPAAPRRDDSRPGESDDGEEDCSCCAHAGEEEVLELRLVEERLHVLQQRHGLQQGEHTCEKKKASM